MDISEIRELVDTAVAEGLLVRSEGTMLSSSEGYNYAGRAVLGALLDNAGQPTFNSYCKNQKSMLGWLSSKGNPISKQARSILKAAGSDPRMHSILTDVDRELIRPLVDEHTRRGGQRPSSAEIDSTCAMLAAKILWDLQMGNADLVRSIKVLEASASTGNAPQASPEQLNDNYRALGASDAQANVANEIAHHIHETSLHGAAYLATTSFDPDPQTIVMVCRELQYFFTYLLVSRVIRERGEQRGGLLCAILGSFGTEYLQRISQRTVGTSLPEEINAEEFQEAFAEYYGAAEEIPTEALCDRIGLHLDSDRSSSINNLVSHVLGQGSFTGFQETGVPTIDLDQFVSTYLAV